MSIHLRAMCLFGCLSNAAQISAQAPDETVTVLAGHSFANGGIHRFFLGDGYRTTWATPVAIEVLDLSEFAGGLTPLKLGGGMQTSSLRMEGADGKQYVFRSVTKDPARSLPSDLQETVVADYVEDLTSSSHPGAALVVPRILEAVGVLHAQPQILYMPDSPLLGEFRQQFAGTVGLIEERPRDDDDPEVSFAGAIEVVSTPDLRDELEENPDVRLDAGAYLDARLVDLLLGDWDRHQDQWRWALAEQNGTKSWLPIPRDRDQAFVRFDGMFVNLARSVAPKWVVYGPFYDNLIGITWNARDIDREFLSPLSHSEWRQRAIELQAVLTTEVFTEATSALPPEWQALDAESMVANLKSRRDSLPAIAEVFYRLLAKEVDVWATDEDEMVDIETDDRGITTLSISRRESPNTHWYRRQFIPDETDELRVYLRGGDDSVVVRGATEPTIRIRLVGGGGDDSFQTGSSGRVKVYDDRGDNSVSSGSVDTRSYQNREIRGDPTSQPHRDWGNHNFSIPSVSTIQDAGVLVGWAGTNTYYKFRHRPFGRQLNWQLQIAPAVSSARGVADLTWYEENRSRFFRLEAMASGVEILRWYGLGNDTEIDPALDDDFYRATEQQARLRFTLGWQLNDRMEVQLGPSFAYGHTDLNSGKNSERFVAVDSPYGTGSFAQAGLSAALRHEGRDVPNNARHGTLLELKVDAYPTLLDVEEPFGRIEALATGYLSAEIPTQPVLAVQAGGVTTVGGAAKIPFHELAFLGGEQHLRGFDKNRFAGNHSAYASAELRLELAHLNLLMPGRQGLFGFWDVGRVWADGDAPSSWHQSVGGGVWLGALTPGGVVSFAVGHSDEGERFHFRFGFAY